jgi:CHAT domain-containing protein
MAATLAHLRQLYALLIEPVRCKLAVSRLIIVPHGCLHYLPFHALYDGARFLIDDYVVSYAPSATVYHLCASKAPGNGRGSLVMGVQDPLLPQVGTEVAAVAGSLPDPVVLMDGDATERRLRELGPGSRFIHIATHGSFRQENPLLSSVRLGDSELRLLDLYTLRLNADLITLSGCGTGLNVVVGADEILGLVRGLLSAGARSALVTLWDVNDASTAEFMNLFYTNLRNGLDCGGALRCTMITIRKKYWHPYFWAPFVLVGAQ